MSDGATNWFTIPLPTKRLGGRDATLSQSKAGTGLRQPAIRMRWAGLNAPTCGPGGCGSALTNEHPLPTLRRRMLYRSADQHPQLHQPVMSTQQENVVSAQNAIQATDYASATRTCRSTRFFADRHCRSGRPTACSRKYQALAIIKFCLSATLQKLQDNQDGAAKAQPLPPFF